MGGLLAADAEWQGRTHSLMIELPPLATLAFKREALVVPEAIEEDPAPVEA